MEENKAKNWFMRHKKEIIAGVLASAVTVVLLKAAKSHDGVKARLNLDLNFATGGKDNDNDWGMGYAKGDHANININDPGLKISDLGKLGEMLLSNIPMLTDDSAVSRLNCNYSKYGKRGD